MLVNQQQSLFHFDIDPGPLYTNDKLSQAQLLAVNTPKPTIVLSAAGTGKTTTMTHRIARAKQIDGLSLDQIFVATFTRKAANEMTQRLQRLINGAPEFTGTFHRNGLMLIKKFPLLVEAHGYKNNIDLIDATDRDRIFTELLKPYADRLKQLNISKTNAKKWMREGIDDLKSQGFYPIDYHCAPAIVNSNNIARLTRRFDELPPDIAFEVYRGYQEELKRMSLLDFDDVMALPVFAMRDEYILDRIAPKFELVVVDEFQDCSSLQFELSEQLAQKGKNLYLVGDEDQLIYGWRDASLKKVMGYYDNPDYHVCYLEENYRSQANIINLAVPVITKNTMRSSKVMKATRPATYDVIQIQPYDNHQEALTVAKTIESLIKKGSTPNQIAIIYRNNDYSIRMEAELVSHKIDYDVVKAYNFFEYMEIKNAVAYLRLALDHTDEMAFRRIFNWPKRKNGEKAFNKIAAYAHMNNCSLFDALRRQERLSSENKRFIAIMERLSYLLHRDVSVKQLMGALISELSLEQVLYEEHGIQEGEERFERVRKLGMIIDVLKEEHLTYEETLRMLNDEMANIQKKPKEQKVQLMTAHAAKGLEFEHVFVVGAVNGMFPSLHGEPETLQSESGHVNTNLEEERRLFYVALTRAKETLVISSPKYIHRFGSVSEYESTMFLDGLDHLYTVQQVNVS